MYYLLLNALYIRVPQLSGNGRGDTGGKGDKIEIENETSGTGLTTTQTTGSLQ
jgi:hypothetical protein